MYRVVYSKYIVCLKTWEDCTTCFPWKTFLFRICSLSSWHRALDGLLVWGQVPLLPLHDGLVAGRGLALHHVHGLAEPEHLALTVLKMSRYHHHPPPVPPLPTSWELFGLLQVSSVITTRAARGGTSQQMIIRRNNVNNLTVFFSFVRCSLRRPGKFRTSWAKQTHPYCYKSQYQCEDL